MKRFAAALTGVLAFLILAVSPAHALKVVVATIALGEVQVIGYDATKSTSITWEGQVEAKSSKFGTFAFSTANLPIDCTGQLSDGVSTISVIIRGCTPQQAVGGGVLRTGQTQCDNNALLLGGCPGNPRGQDGELQKGRARSYTDNGDGTIIDDSTGLVWEKLTNDATIHNVNDVYSWAEAFLVKIATLNTAPCFANHCDWRLPNLNELQSLADYGRVGPAINLRFNAGGSFTESAAYWSSTSYQDSPNSAWYVFFHDGVVDLSSKNNFGHVRAVRGGS